MFLLGAHLMKALAYEMAGDYAAASKSYAAYKFFSANQERGCVVTAEPRLAYKEGKRRKAFRGYCELFALEEGDSPSEKPASNRLRFPKTATSTILLLDYAEKDRVLTPFAEYSDFLTFMEAEFKAQGEPAEYAEAMEFLRSCAAKEANGVGGERKPAVADETNDDVAR